MNPRPLPLAVIATIAMSGCGDSGHARPAAPTSSAEPSTESSGSTQPSESGEPAVVAEPPGAASPGALSIQVNGGWAEVWIDGAQATQETPLNAFELSPGPHHVRVSSPETGQTLLEERLDIQSEEMTILVIEARTGTVRRSSMEY